MKRRFTHRSPEDFTISTDASSAHSSRTMIVTGASSGIGYELSLAAAQRGWNVVAVGRRAERLAVLVQRIAALGGQCEAVAVDVTAKEAPRRIVDAAKRRFGRIDVIVHNAGN